MQGLSIAIDEQIAAVLALLAFRCVPFVAYVAIAMRFRTRTKLVALGAFGALALVCKALGASASEFLVRTPLALVYFGAVVAIVYRMPARVSAGLIRLPALLALLVTASVMLPALLVPFPWVAPSLLLGWEVALSSYSYCVDVARSRSTPTFHDCAFFILVNPVLVYAERGTPISKHDGLRAVARIALGSSALLVSTLVPAVIPKPGVADPLAPAQVWFGVALATYSAHSGLASIQIGLMRIIGWSIPERFDHPFLATGPLDFWRRWNRWLAAWARRYLYVPLARTLGRRRGVGIRWVQATSVLATFLAIGVMHDFYRYVSQLHEQHGREFRFEDSYAFAIFGVSVVGWLAISRIPSARVFQERSAQRTRPLLVAQWLTFWVYTAFVALVFFPPHVTSEAQLTARRESPGSNGP